MIDRRGRRPAISILNNFSGYILLFYLLWRQEWWKNGAEGRKKKKKKRRRKKEMNEDDAVSIVFIPYCDLLLNVRFSLYFLNYKNINNSTKYYILIWII